MRGVTEMFITSMLSGRSGDGRTPAVQGPRRLRRRRQAAVGGLLLLGAVSTIAGASGASPAGHARSPLASGEAFYRGKTITFVDPSAPGGGIDTTIRTIAPYIGQFLHATVNVESIPAGNTIGGADVAASAAPDGLTIGFFDSLNVVEQVAKKAPGLTFSPTHLNFLGGAQAQASYGWLASTAASCPVLRSWDDLIAQGSAAQPFPIITETTGTAETLATFALAAFPSHVVIRGGYGSENQLVAGFQRGDACVVTGGANVFAALITGGRARGIALTSPPPSADASEYAGTLTFAQLVKKDARLITTRRAKAAAKALVEFSSGLPSFEFTARGVPADRVLALQAAVKWTASNPTFQTALLATGNTPLYTSGPKALASYENAVRFAKPFVSFFGP